MVDETPDKEAETVALEGYDTKPVGPAFAGRDTQVARTPEPSTLASGSDPRRSLGSIS